MVARRWQVGSDTVNKAPVLAGFLLQLFGQIGQRLFLFYFNDPTHVEVLDDLGQLVVIVPFLSDPLDVIGGHNQVVVAVAKCRWFGQPQWWPPPSSTDR